MDVRLTAEQQELRAAATRLAKDLGPKSVADLDDSQRIGRLERTVADTGWRSLRSDGASGVEVALVAEEFARGLVDVPFLGTVLAEDLKRHADADVGPATIVDEGSAPDCRGISTGLGLDGAAVFTVELGDQATAVDLTRLTSTVRGTPAVIGQPSTAQSDAWRALALVTTSADLVGAARGALELATEYAKLRQQYGKTIGSYQAVAHLLAESLALIAGSTSLLWYAAWAVDALSGTEAIEAGRHAKLYCAHAARTVCETAIQVHGGIGNTWECLAHVYLRRTLVSAGLWPVALKEITVGLP
jgi:hypothetical protein